MNSPGALLQVFSPFLTVAGVALTVMSYGNDTYSRYATLLFVGLVLLPYLLGVLVMLLLKILER